MATCTASTLEESLMWEIAPWQRGQEEAGNKAFPQSLSDGGEQGEGRVGAGESKGGKGWKQKRKRDNGGTVGEVKLQYPDLRVIPWWHLRQLLSKQDSLLKQNVPHRCGDRGISREGGRKEQQRVPFSPSLAPTWPFSPRVVLAVFIVPSQSTQVYLERKLEAFSVHHHDWDTSFSRARVDWACTPSMSEFTQTQDFCSLDCNILRVWSESATGNGPKRRYYVYNWKDVDIW